MPELIDTIKALADAPCPGPARRDCQGMGPALHTPHCHEGCNGTGRHPLTEPLRVECDHGHSVNPKHWADEKKHRADCPGYRAATPQEAKSLLAEMMALSHEKLNNRYISFHWEEQTLVRMDSEVLGRGFGPTPEDAFYLALAAALGVEVESDVSSRP